MAIVLDTTKVSELAAADKELKINARALTGTVRFELSGGAYDFVMEDGEAKHFRRSSGVATVTISAPDHYWEEIFKAHPQPGFESLTMGLRLGLKIDADFFTVQAPYFKAFQRMVSLMRIGIHGNLEVPVPSPYPYKATDTAVGRYVYMTVEGIEYRVYYEESGTGDTPVIFQHTAGADGRQYRHLLAHPEMQKKFRMIAYDLPYHGKSVPPGGVRWWEETYSPDRELIMSWVVGLSDALELDRPIFVGCSVGGQLALDLAAFYPDHFRGCVSVNGFYDMEHLKGFSNDIFRHPLTTTDYYSALCLGATGPGAPEGYRREVYWIYRSNFPGIYAGDNDYFMFGHDLRIDGHRIDATKLPVYVLSGEYDLSAHDEVHGGPAVAKHVKGVIFRKMPGLSHFAPADDPAGFIGELLPVLEEIRERVAVHA